MWLLLELGTNSYFLNLFYVNNFIVCRYGGLICSLNLKRGGVKKVCLIDKRGKVGGTCLFEGIFKFFNSKKHNLLIKGCIPSKCLLNAS